MSYSGSTTNEAQEAPYLGSAIVGQDHSEPTDWLCPKCIEDELDHGLYHNRVGFFCLECGGHYANDGELARSYTELFANLYKRIGELEGERDFAKRRQGDAEAKLREVRRVAA